MPRASLAAALCAAAFAAHAAPDCAALYKKHLTDDLSMPYKAFDQSGDGAGWRLLAGQGCEAQAADLVDRYIEANGSRRALIWHSAQLRAASGDYTRAIDAAKRSLNSNENLSKDPLRWNDYVNGVIAFLEANRAKLVHYRDEVAKGKDDHPGNVASLRVLDSMVRNFDGTYKEAIEKSRR